MTTVRSWFAAVLFMTAMSTSGCYLTFPSQVDPEEDLGIGGGSQLVLQLPVEVGRELMCVQGVHGSYSHNLPSTRFDLDLDTSNAVREEVYAPTSGVAHVHMQSATSGFGYHINIDVGSNQYVVVAHLDEVFIEDGVEVAQGQLIGYEGCTGFCTGDHIHVGLHEGSAAQTADRGISIEATYITRDASHGGMEGLLASTDFVCGIEALGDEHNGHFYESSLPVPRWYPDGTLVKTPDNAKVYAIEDGRAQWIEDEDVFASLNLRFSDVVVISDEALACHGEGFSVGGEAFIRAFTDIQMQYWLVLGDEEDPERRRMRLPDDGWSQVLASWGLNYDQNHPPPIYPDQSSFVQDWPVSSLSARFRNGSLVTEETSSAVYAISNGAALPIETWDTYLLAGFEPRQIIGVPDGVVEGVQQLVGSCAADAGCITAERITTCGGGLEFGTGGDVGGPTGDDDVDSPSDDDDSAEGDLSDSPDPEPSVPCDGADACIVDQDADGTAETLLMVSDSWIDSSLSRFAAYVYGNGGCYDATLTSADIVFATDNYYQIDFTAFTVPCAVELSLISGMGTDGNAPHATSMGNWYWWQNQPFCSQGQNMCQLMDNGTNWEEWLLAVNWDPAVGLTAIGNGLTSNSQL